MSRRRSVMLLCLIILSLDLLVVAFLLGVSQFSGKYETVKHQYETQKVCDRSHQVIDHELETICGNLQEKYHTSYSCVSPDPGADCWVEVK